MPADRLDTAADRVIRDALAVSGDIVLQAAKRSVSAGEMLGLILSRYLIQHEFWRVCGSPQKNPVQVFFLLDDYASWLAQRESHIADLLGLCIEESAEGIRLAVVESKYVAAEAAADAKRGSRAQLLATLTTLREALFGDPGRLDRDLWLSAPGGLAHRCRDPQTRPPCSSARDEIRKGHRPAVTARLLACVPAARTLASQTRSRCARRWRSARPRSPSRRSSTTALRRIAKPMCSSAIRPRSVNQSMATSRGEVRDAHAPAARVHLDRHDWQARGGDRIRYR